MMRTRLRHIWLVLSALPALVFSARKRALFQQMRVFSQNLPTVLKAPLPQALKSITPAAQSGEQAESDIRKLADAAALLDRGSPLGLCLRRSLTRYHFLRHIDVPVVLQFGAKFVDGQADREITGHAWLTLDGQPYFESGENWEGFIVMLTWSDAVELDASG